MKIKDVESGYDFVTFYFYSTGDMNTVAQKLYRYLKRISFLHYDLQRKNFCHLPGDVPHFHDGIDATKGPHIHVIYPDRPTEEDIEALRGYLMSRLVGVTEIPDHIEEIS